MLSQLDELRRVNRQLRMHALEFGWEWEPATQSLVMARNRREVAASIDRQERRSQAAPRNGIMAIDREEEV